MKVSELLPTTLDLPTQITQLEQEISRKQEELNALRKQMPSEEITNYQLLGPDNQPVHLSELFGDKDDLIVIHNMGAGCEYCTLWADGFNGVLPHLENRAAFVVVSPDAPQAQQKFAASRGWKLRMVSAKESSFTKDLGYSWEQDGEMYMMPGFSTLKRTPEGKIVRIAHAAFGPGDPYSSIWHLFALLGDGVNGWEPKFRYA